LRWKLSWRKAESKWHRTSWIEGMIAIVIPMFAAAGYAFLYLLLGGGFGGALLIFLFAKMLGK
jgi:hypothetical protein